MRVELDRQRLCLSLSYDNEEKDKTINLRAFRPTSPPEGGFWTLPTRVRKRWADTKAKVTSAQHQAEARAHAPPPSLKGAPARPRPAPQDEKDASSSGFESKIDSYFVKDGVVQLPVVGVMLVLYTEGDAGPFLSRWDSTLETHMVTIMMTWRRRAAEMVHVMRARGLLFGGSATPATIQLTTLSTYSSFQPGWRDLGDRKVQIMFSAKTPNAHKDSNVKGPVVRFTDEVPAESVALHSFELTKQHKLPRDVKEYLADLAEAHPEDPPSLKGAKEPKRRKL